VSEYPPVVNEYDTLSKLHQGYSIARFGDGEFKIVAGKEYVREPRNERLTAEIREVLRNPPQRCLIGIPTMDPMGPKYASWARHIKRFERMLPKDRDYYSALISRPDSAPWINTVQFATLYAYLWRDKRVAILCEKDGSAHRAVAPGASSLVKLRCPRHEAYQFIDKFESRILDAGVDIAILSCGPTATCLAARLARQGVQAIDFGSGGSFIAKLLYA
jgi:hypothetical protein